MYLKYILPILFLGVIVPDILAQRPSANDFRRGRTQFWNPSGPKQVRLQRTGTGTGSFGRNRQSVSVQQNNRRRLPTAHPLESFQKSRSEIIIEFRNNNRQPSNPDTRGFSQVDNTNQGRTNRRVSQFDNSNQGRSSQNFIGAPSRDTWTAESTRPDQRASQTQNQKQHDIHVNTKQNMQDNFGGNMHLNPNFANQENTQHMSSQSNNFGGNMQNVFPGINVGQSNQNINFNRINSGPVDINLPSEVLGAVNAVPLNSNGHNAASRSGLSVQGGFDNSIISASLVKDNSIGLSGHMTNGHITQQAGNPALPVNTAHNTGTSVLDGLVQVQTSQQGNQQQNIGIDALLQPNSVSNDIQQIQGLKGELNQLKTLLNGVLNKHIGTSEMHQGLNKNSIGMSSDSNSPNINLSHNAVSQHSQTDNHQINSVQSSVAAALNHNQMHTGTAQLHTQQAINAGQSQILQNQASLGNNLNSNSVTSQGHLTGDINNTIDQLSNIITGTIQNHGLNAGSEPNKMSNPQVGTANAGHNGVIRQPRIEPIDIDYEEILQNAMANRLLGSLDSYRHFG